MSFKKHYRDVAVAGLHWLCRKYSDFSFLFSSKKALSKRKFGVLYAPTINIGDFFQTLAQIEALKKLGITDYVFVNRERLATYAGEPVNLLMGGWYMLEPNQFPPPERINPICISIYIEDEALVKDHYDYWKKHEPIGCRDEATVQVFKKHGVEAYLTKCLTLIFDKYDGVREGIYLVDVDNVPSLPIPKYKEVEHEFRRKKQNAMTKLTRGSKHSNMGHNVLAETLREASDLLEIYKKAELVITSRLHCALPCRAFNTPVIFIHTDYSKDRRFTGLYRELNGSDGSAGDYAKSDGKIDYGIIQKDQENLLADMSRRIDEIRRS